MIVTLLTVKSVSSLALPKKVRGIFYLISDDDNVSYRFSIEAVEEKDRKSTRLNSSHMA